MEVKDLITILSKAIEEKKTKLVERKENISNIYSLAKHDFLVIDNMTDSLLTYKDILKMCEDLQDRIIERNRNN